MTRHFRTQGQFGRNFITVFKSPFGHFYFIECCFCLSYSILDPELGSRPLRIPVGGMIYPLNPLFTNPAGKYRFVLRRIHSDGKWWSWWSWWSWSALGILTLNESLWVGKSSAFFSPKTNSARGRVAVINRTPMCCRKKKKKMLENVQILFNKHFGHTVW